MTDTIENDASAKLAELEEAYADGADVTLEQVEKARAAAEKATFRERLKARRERRDAEKAAQAEHDAAVQALETRYAQLVTSDLDDLRQAYAATVKAAGDFWRQLQEYDAERKTVAGWEKELGIESLSVGDRRYLRGSVEQYFDWALQEGKTGLPPARTNATGVPIPENDSRHVHVLHTPERAEELTALGKVRRERHLELEAQRRAERERRAEEERRYEQEIERQRMRKAGYRV
jgi:hypothetical protein